MKEKAYIILKRVYSITMSVAFFGGIVPLIPYVVAIIIGGTTGENVALFLYKQYYPWVIALASIAIVIGLIAMYVGGKQGLSVKKINAEKE